MKTVILAHGIFDTERVFKRLIRALKAQGFNPQAIRFRPNTGRGGLPRLAQQLADFVEEHRRDDEKVLLVGFSMGGIVSRYYLQRLGGLNKVARFIAVSSPHHGTQVGRIALNKGARELRPGSALLTDLKRDAETLLKVNVACLWTPYDLMIIPAQSCVLGYGPDYAFKVPLHALMIKNAKVIAKIGKLLAEVE